MTVSVFGSVGRGDAGQDSDVDVAVRLANDFFEGGFDYFSRLETLEQRLSSLLGCKVDAIEEPVRKQSLQVEIDRDRALAFSQSPAPVGGHHRERISHSPLRERDGFEDVRGRSQDLRCGRTLPGADQRSRCKRGDMAVHLMPDRPWQ